jgi:hypothetical protein
MYVYIYIYIYTHTHTHTYIHISNEYVMLCYTFIYANCIILSVPCEVTGSRSAAVPQDWRRILRDM